MTSIESRKKLTGKVLISKMEKTAVVEVSRRFAHPLYKKYVTKTKKYYAHDPNNSCSSGDVVSIVEGKPTSRLKRWRVLSIISQAKKG
ncbi:MAG: 30S ribosomal protein S17 [Candidatus Marinimicrobia bacterium]|nr:30S ribosomal protein S17 [Candidatus Neomarinimicrobiota bacterium]